MKRVWIGLFLFLLLVFQGACSFSESKNSASGPLRVYIEELGQGQDKIYIKAGQTPRRELSDDEYLLARCIFAEAVGLGKLGMIGVACVIRNRVESGSRKYGRGTYKSVILKKSQFSCATPPGSPLWRTFAQASQLSGANRRGFKIAIELANRTINGRQPDITSRATIYMTPKATRRTGWLKNAVNDGRLEQCYKDPGHVFFRYTH